MGVVEFTVVMYFILPAVRSECEERSNIAETQCGSYNIAHILGFSLIGIAVVGVVGLIIFRVIVFRKTGKCFQRHKTKRIIPPEKPINIEMSVVNRRQKAKTKRKSKQQQSKSNRKPYMSSIHQGQRHVRTPRNQFQENVNDHLRYVGRTRFDGAARFYRGAEYYEDELDEQEQSHPFESRQLEQNQRPPPPTNISEDHLRYPGVAVYNGRNEFSRGRNYYEEDQSDQYPTQIPDAYAVIEDERYPTPPPTEEIDEGLDNAPEIEELDLTSENGEAGPEEGYEETTDEQQYDI